MVNLMLLLMAVILLVNVSNASTEAEQVSILSEVLVLIEKFDINLGKKFIFAGDCNLILDSLLDASGGNLALIKKSLAKCFN